MPTEQAAPRSAQVRHCWPPLCGHRFYAADLGRVLSPDPAHSDANWYAYCGSDPVNAANPSGLDPQGDKPPVTPDPGAFGPGTTVTYQGMTYDGGVPNYNYLVSLGSYGTVVVSPGGGGTAGASGGVLSSGGGTSLITALGSAVLGMMMAGDGDDDPVSDAEQMAADDSMAAAVTSAAKADTAATSVVSGGGDTAASLYHYTTEEGMNGIMDSGYLNPSLKTLNPADARFGDGQYLSDIIPGTKTPAQLSRTFLAMPFQAQRFTNFVEINTEGLNVVARRPGVFVVPNSGPLDLTGRILSFGSVP